MSETTSQQEQAMDQDQAQLNSQRELPVAEMTIVDHLQELRQRIIIALTAIIAGSTACYFFVEKIIAYIIRPAGKLYYMNPAEAFMAYIKTAVFSGFLLVLPIVLYQAWAFIVPALTRSERKLFVALMPVSVVLFYIGLAFSYFLVLPMAVTFFMGFATDTLQPMFSLGQYISFVISLLFPFGFIFELPLFIMVLAKMGIISSTFLVSKRKVVLVGAFVVGGVVSPTPDIFGQLMLALPLMLLFEMSVWVIRVWFGK
ncbi:twin-arginine translocase subunit TatC [Acetonema longum]|uniref:Sec-independent protein translocase protein TatC n=1 Tax=Acetonema longum DSM 6540 TaxID=1009370 RepID=F7NHL9_9FIRM|nr:twin-arginine translocase subunit TatC [Acetonema longum]EGO64394.1 Sec-independent protein translocase, TatC subunit [Acetonema longum DSM 6540]